jgi:hypothetical protein
MTWGHLRAARRAQERAHPLGKPCSAALDKEANLTAQPAPCWKILSLWYTPMQGEARKTKVRVQQVLAADLKLAPVSDENRLPANMGKKKKAEAVKLGALKIASEEHEELLDEIHRRECIEHEDEVDGDSGDESESERSESEGDEAGNDE